MDRRVCVVAWVEEYRGRFRVRMRGADGVTVMVAWCGSREEGLALAARVPRVKPDRVARRERREARWRERGYGRLARIRPGSDPRLEVWVGVWRAGLVVNAATAVRYECLVRVHVLPRFGWMRLSGISRPEVKEWARELGRRYKPATVASIVAVLSGILSEAVRAGLIPVNPAQRLTVVRERRPAWEVPGPAGIAELAAALDPMFELLVLTAAYTGMRWGELAGLHRRNVHLAGPGAGFVPNLRVDPLVGALHEVGGRCWLGPPKTGAAERVVHLPPFLAGRLAAHLEAHPYPFVFCGERGGWLRRSNFQSRIWTPALARARERGCGLPEPLTFHRLRHVHKSWMAEDHTPPSLQDYRLGHAPRGAQGVYEHHTLAMVARLMNGLEARWAARGSAGFEPCGPALPASALFLAPPT